MILVDPTSGTTKRVLDLSGPKFALAIALEPILNDLRYVIVCPRCVQAEEPSPYVQGANHRTDARVTLECACTIRRGKASELRAVPSDVHLLMATSVFWKDADMEVRCPKQATGCLKTRLAMLDYGDRMTIRCGCGQDTIQARAAAPAGRVH